MATAAFSRVGSDLARQDVARRTAAVLTKLRVIYDKALVEGGYSGLGDLVVEAGGVWADMRGVSRAELTVARFVNETLGSMSAREISATETRCQRLWRKRVGLRDLEIERIPTLDFLRDWGTERIGDALGVGSEHGE
jgi:hypothetical protein